MFRPLLPDGYRLRRGDGLDRALLLKFARQTYGELLPNAALSALSETVERYFSGATPVWFIETETVAPPASLAIACLWLGTAIDQAQGGRHANIFLLYVAPEHRRRGLGSALLATAETWAQERGDRQITLQVFHFNEPAIRLYESLGYQVQSWVMHKPLQPS